MPPKKRNGEQESYKKHASKTKVLKIEGGSPKKASSKKLVGERIKNKNQSGSCWLVKSEPESRFEKGIDVKFSFDDLKASPNQTSCWDGVRNYQARNILRDQMKVGDSVFFYHSNCKEPGIIGICQVVKESYPDHTQFDPKDPHYDSSSPKDNPRWFMVDVKYVRPLKRFLCLAELKKIHLDHVKTGGALKNMALFTRARLSVQPVSQEEWDFIVKMELEETKA